MPKLTLDTAWTRLEWLEGLAWPVRAVWPVLLCHVKAKGNGRGSCGALKPAAFAAEYGIPETNVRALLVAAVANGHLAIEGEVWTITCWEKSDSAERVKRHREKANVRDNSSDVTLQAPDEPDVTLHLEDGGLQVQNEPDVTLQAALLSDVTLHSEDVPPLRVPPPPNTSPPPYNPPSDTNPPVIPQKSRVRRAGRQPNPVFDEPWQRFVSVYPKRIGGLCKAPARLKFDLLAAQGEDLEAIVEGARAYRLQQEAIEKAGTEFVAQMTTWLNQRRWEEDYSIPMSAVEAKERKSYPKEGVDYGLRMRPGFEIPQLVDLKTGAPFDRDAWMEQHREQPNA